MYIDDYKDIPISEHGRKRWNKKTKTVFVSIVIVLYIVISMVLTGFIQKSYQITYAAKYGGNYEKEGLPTGFFITLIFFVGVAMSFGNFYGYLRNKKVCSVPVEAEVFDFWRYPSELNEKKGSALDEYEYENKKKPIYQYEYNGQIYRVKGFAFKNKTRQQGEKIKLKINPDYPTEIYYPWEHGVVDTIVFVGFLFMLPFVLEVISLIKR